MLKGCILAIACGACATVYVHETRLECRENLLRLKYMRDHADPFFTTNSERETVTTSIVWQMRWLKAPWYVQIFRPPRVAWIDCPTDYGYLRWLEEM